MSQASRNRHSLYRSMKHDGVHPDTAIYLVDLEAKMDNIAAQMATKTEVGNLRESMTREFAAVRGEMSKEFAGVRREIGALRESTTTEFAAVRGEISKVREDVLSAMDAKLTTLKEDIVSRVLLRAAAGAAIGVGAVVGLATLVVMLLPYIKS